MLAVGILVAVLVVAVVAVVAVGRGDVMADAPVDRPDVGLPHHRPISAADLPRLRFSLGLRGYRMSEVDSALERIGAAMASLEHEVTELRASRRTPHDTTVGDEPGPPA